MIGEKTGIVSGCHKVPGRDLRKPGKTGGPEKSQDGLNMFNI